MAPPGARGAALCTHMSPLSGSPSQVGHQGALGRVPCAPHQALASDLVLHMVLTGYMCQSQYPSPSHALPLPLCFPLFFHFQQKFQACGDI